MWFFLLFFGIGLVLTISGFALDIPLLNLVGTIMIFLVGLTLLQDGLTYKVGEKEIYQYGNNFSGYHWDYYGNKPNFDPATLNDTDTVFLFHTNTTNQYDSYDDAGENRFGWLLLAMGALLFCLSLFRL